MNESRFRDAEQLLWASVGATPSERHVRLARVGTSVRVLEVGSGPPLLFVHGVSNGGSSWASLAAKVDGYRCMIVDRPGCGLSEPLPTRFDDVAALSAFGDAFIVDVLDALAVDTADVIATSFGGYVGLRGAAAHPDRISRLVLCGWSVGAPIGHVPLVMRLSALPGMSRLGAAMPVNDAMVRALFRRIGLRNALESGRVTAEMVEWFKAMLNCTDTMRNEIAAGPRLLTLRGMNESILLAEDLLGSIRTPTFFLWGEEDPFGGAEVAREFATKVPGAELELMPGAGHAVWMDDADHAAKSIEAFLER